MTATTAHGPRSLDPLPASELPDYHPLKLFAKDMTEFFQAYGSANGLNDFTASMGVITDYAAFQNGYTTLNEDILTSENKIEQYNRFAELVALIGNMYESAFLQMEGPGSTAAQHVRQITDIHTRGLLGEKDLVTRKWENDRRLCEDYPTWLVVRHIRTLLDERKGQFRFYNKTIGLAAPFLNKRKPSGREGPKIPPSKAPYQPSHPPSRRAPPPTATNATKSQVPRSKSSQAVPIKVPFPFPFPEMKRSPNPLPEPDIAADRARLLFEEFLEELAVPDWFGKSGNSADTVFAELAAYILAADTHRKLRGISLRKLLVEKISAERRHLAAEQRRPKLQAGPITLPHSYVPYSPSIPGTTWLQPPGPPDYHPPSANRDYLNFDSDNTQLLTTSGSGYGPNSEEWPPERPMTLGKAERCIRGPSDEYIVTDVMGSMDDRRRDKELLGSPTALETNHRYQPYVQMSHDRRQWEEEQQRHTLAPVVDPSRFQEVSRSSNGGSHYSHRGSATSKLSAYKAVPVKAKVAPGASSWSARVSTAPSASDKPLPSTPNGLRPSSRVATATSSQRHSRKSSIAGTPPDNKADSNVHVDPHTARSPRPRPISSEAASTGGPNVVLQLPTPHKRHGTVASDNATDNRSHRSSRHSRSASSHPPSGRGSLSSFHKKDAPTTLHPAEQLLQPGNSRPHSRANSTRSAGSARSMTRPTPAASVKQRHSPAGSLHPSVDQDPVFRPISPHPSVHGSSRSATPSPQAMTEERMLALLAASTASPSAPLHEDAVVRMHQISLQLIKLLTKHSVPVTDANIDSIMEWAQYAVEAGATTFADLNNLPDWLGVGEHEQQAGPVAATA